MCARWRSLSARERRSASSSASACVTGERCAARARAPMGQARVNGCAHLRLGGCRARLGDGLRIRRVLHRRRGLRRLLPAQKISQLGALRLRYCNLPARGGVLAADGAELLAAVLDGPLQLDLRLDSQLVRLLKQRQLALRRARHVGR